MNEKHDKYVSDFIELTSWVLLEDAAGFILI